MSLGPRLDLRQSQSLVMTPQLQQAIKLLALSNLEIEAFIGEALDANPLLEIGEAAPGDASDGPDPSEQRRTTLESSPADQLIAEGRAADDRPLDIDRGALDTNRDTGDGEWGSSERYAVGEAGPVDPRSGPGWRSAGGECRLDCADDCRLCHQPELWFAGLAWQSQRHYSAL